MNIPTMAERAEQLERVLIARSICRTGKFPTPTDLAKESRKLNGEGIHGVRVDPEVSRNEAAAFLTAMKLTAPAFEPPKRDFE